MSAMPSRAWKIGAGIIKERSAPATTNGTAPTTRVSASLRSTSPYWMNASAELESPKDSLMRPIFTSVWESSVSPASRGKMKMRNGTNSAEPLIPTVLTMVAPRRKNRKRHQYSSQ